MDVITLERVYSPACEQSNAINATKDKSVKRNDMVGFYADCLRCAAIHGVHSISWIAVNGAIVDRWPKGLNYIKKQAWKQL